MFESGIVSPASEIKIQALVTPPQKSEPAPGHSQYTCGSGWVRSCAATELLNTGVKAAHPPPTAGGTDCVQQRIRTLEAKSALVRFLRRSLIHTLGTVFEVAPVPETT